MKNLFVLSILVAIFMLCSALHCVREDDDCHLNIEIVNNASHDIWYGNSGKLSQNYKCGRILVKVPADSIFNDDLIRTCWETRINQTNDGALVYYFFEEDFNTITNCNVDSLNAAVVERREVTVEELRQNNWQVVYP